MADSDEEIPRRSRAHTYRQQGSRAKRFCYEEQDANRVDNAGNVADIDEQDANLVYDVGPNVADIDEQPNAFGVMNQPHVAGDDLVSDESQSDVDSYSSEEMNNYLGGDSDTEQAEYDPVLDDEEQDFVVFGDRGPSDESSDEDDDEENFNLRLQPLSLPLQFSQPRTAKECLLLALALSVRHKTTYECLIDTLQSQNLILGGKYLPSSKKELWKVLGRNNSGIVFYAYCRKCKSFIGKKKHIGEYAVCPECGERTKKNETSYFASFSIRRQLQGFLALPEAAHLLGYRERRVKKSEDEADIEDIFDSEGYKSIRVDGQELFNSNNYSYHFNTDGCKLKKGGKLSVYPLFIRINELEPGLRQKFMFLAGLYVDRTEPEMTTFLHPFVKQMNRLATRGLDWTKNNEEVTSKFVSTCFCVDGKARSQILNMCQHNSHHGCTRCTYFGVSVNRIIRYPTQHPELPAYQDRTHAGMVADMLQAQNQPGNPVRGHKGITPLACLKYLDLAKGNASDDLHSVYECAAVHHTEILVKEVPRLDETMGEPQMFRIIDARLKAIKVPSCIARTAGITDFKNRKQMHGTEWRNWLLYFGPICMHGLVPDRHVQHFERLSYATYLLSLDIIKPEYINQAQQLINDYLSLYDDYGIDKTRRNLHEISHAPDSVRSWGAYWCYSTFNFESWNHQIMQLVKSPKGAMQQIISRHLIHQTLELLPYSEDVSQDVRERIKTILHKKRHKKFVAVGESSYFLGKSSQRAPTFAESNVLLLHNLQTDSLRVFDKLMIRGTRYTTDRYTRRKPEARIDDSSIFTFQNTFCTIQDVISFRANDAEVHGLFVLEHSKIMRPRPVFPYAKHLCPVQHDRGMLHFIRVNQVRAPVVKAPLLGDMFFIPVPNLNEID